MPEKLIVDFISSQLHLGAHIEKIRSDLITNGWTDEDIDKALAKLKKQEQANASKKPILISTVIFVVILFIMGTVFFLFFDNKIPTISKPIEDVIQFPDLNPKTPEPVVDTTPAIVVDINSVKEKFIAQFSDMTYVRAHKEGDFFVVTAIPADSTSASTSQDFVYIKEENEWRMSAIQTQIRQDKILEIASSTKPLPIAVLAVTDIIIRPSPPLVNNIKTEIEFKIRNSGVASSSEKTEFTIYFDDRLPQKQTYAKVITPNETILLKFKPYGTTQKYSDEIGEHFVMIDIEGEATSTKSLDLY